MDIDGEEFLFEVVVLDPYRAGHGSAGRAPGVSGRRSPPIVL